MADRSLIPLCVALSLEVRIGAARVPPSPDVVRRATTSVASSTPATTSSKSLASTTRIDVSDTTASTRRTESQTRTRNTTVTASHLPPNTTATHTHLHFPPHPPSATPSLPPSHSPFPVVAIVILTVLGVFLVFLAFGCVSARRKRRERDGTERQLIGEEVRRSAMHQVGERIAGEEEWLFRAPPPPYAPPPPKYGEMADVTASRIRWTPVPRTDSPSPPPSIHSQHSRSSDFSPPTSPTNGQQLLDHDRSLESATPFPLSHEVESPIVSH